MRPATPPTTADCSTASSSSSPPRAAAAPPMATVITSVVPMEAGGPIKVAAAHKVRATPRVRRGEEKQKCSNSSRIARPSEPPYTRHSGSTGSSAGGDGSPLERHASEEADVEENEEDIVVDELDLYCGTSALLYQSPVTDIVWSNATADLFRSAAQATVSAGPPAGRRVVDALSSTRTPSSSASSPSSASRKPRRSGTSVNELDCQEEEGSANKRGVADDAICSGAGDHRVAGAPSRHLMEIIAHPHDADNAEASVGFEGHGAAAPIVGSWQGRDTNGGQHNGITGPACASAEATATRSDQRKACGEGVNVDVCSSSPSSGRRQDCSGDSGNGKGGGEHGARDDGDAEVSQGVAKKSTSIVPVDVQAPPTSLRRWSAAAAPPPASGTEDGSYMPPLMDEFDGELLQLIKAYYLRKQSTAAVPTPLYPPPPPSLHEVPPQAAVGAASSSFAPTCCTGHAPNRVSSGCSSASAGGSDGKGGSRLLGPAAAAEKRRSDGGVDALLDSCFPPLSIDDKQAPCGPLRSPSAVSPAADAAAVIDARKRGPKEPEACPLGDRRSSYAVEPSDDAALASAGAARPRFRENALHRTPCMGRNVVNVHNDSTRVACGAATATVAASSFSLRQHNSPPAASSYDPATLGEASRGQHRDATGQGAATLHEGAAVLRHQTHGGTTISGGSGAGSALGSGIASSLSALSSLPSYSSTSFVRAYVSDISLSLEPAIIVSALTAALNIIVVYFLQQHVLDTRDHLGLFLIGSYMIFSSYYMIYYFLERFSDSFRRIASQDKKFYIIGNLIKAGILISITPFACVHLVKIIVFDEWESNILRNLGCIYAIPDFISMVIVRRMRWSTWVHHACVVLFNYFSIMNNYQHENVCRCVVVYAAFSSFAYCVNVLLASRFLGVSASVARVLSFVALVVYALCCAVNWAWQVYYLRRLLISGHDHWTVYVYMCLISLVMWDDIVLNNWLLHHARNNAYAASQHLQQHRTRQQQQQQQQQPSSVSPLIMSASLSQRPSPLYRSQNTRAVYTAPPPLPPIGLPPRAP
ncbi:conserved hypothetical protein [Leishmania braziliensis MHOM/BR/75/M2904]|uniref:Uncharacterized protein n=2 Tax=Leishmania braziliensis TaxID=5660 RepID=A4HGI4_LEIBR|nr:conserved hypothetical protein [Leishmania braziliensis MHOM/BR/75/M2904]KAI5687358.1 hypothetical protein MNV84_00332 [Leishmania braziliensis]CAJ2465903.1 unnamed protein product [Leishmania braziliensis]CAM39677.2 conserved hypothetical protein [Leishmania braziliensis MHOM/BR/75/M2904]SYZ62508.1 hypothetical_protein [Leishmania braziliensis MHOM/BR/75/M2904]